MNFIDTSVVSHVLEDGIPLREDYFLAPDAVEEVEMAQLIHGGPTPRRILEIGRHTFFDQAKYLNHYKNVLNSVLGRSFFNMGGFGDVSLLATLRTITEAMEASRTTQLPLFDASEDVVVYTTDSRLARRIQAEFANRSVRIAGLSDLI